QLLIQTGFALPWTENLLLPALPVYGCREMAEVQQVQVARSETHLTIEACPWTLTLKTEDAKRYPDVEKVIPKEQAIVTRLQPRPDDAQGAVQKLPTVPSSDKDPAAITLDLASNPPCLRWRRDGSEAKEICLARSMVKGPGLQVAVDRRHLIRALTL